MDEEKAVVSGINKETYDTKRKLWVIYIFVTVVLPNVVSLLAWLLFSETKFSFDVLLSSFDDINILFYAITIPICFDLYKTPRKDGKSDSALNKYFGIILGMSLLQLCFYSWIKTELIKNVALEVVLLIAVLISTPHFCDAAFRAMFNYSVEEGQ